MNRSGMSLAVAAMLIGCSVGDRVPETRVQRGDLVLGIEVTGQLKATESQPLGPPALSDVWNFKIAFMVPEGAEVEEGEPLLRFDVSELRRRLQERQAERDSAAKRLETQRATAAQNRRDEALAIAEAEAAQRKAELKAEVPKDSTASIVIKKAELDLELARARVGFEKRKAAAAKRRDGAQIAQLRDQKERAEERVATIEESIQKMTVKAPRAGTVLYVENWRGETKKVGETVWRAHKVIEVVGLDKMKAIGQVDEIDSSRVEVGQKVTLRLDAHPDVDLSGRVVKIADAVRRKSPDQPLKVVDVDIELDPTEEVRLRPGMRLRGDVETGRVEDVLSVPIAAVRATEAGPVVYRMEDGKGAPVRVEVGQRNRHRVEIRGGLEEGEELVILDPEGGGA